MSLELVNVAAASREVKHLFVNTRKSDLRPLPFWFNTLH